MQALQAWAGPRAREHLRRHGLAPADVAAILASCFLDNVIVLAPSPDWQRALPGGKLPDRNDFRSCREDVAGRQRVWRGAVAESRRLADEFAELVRGSRAIEAQPLP